MARAAAARTKSASNVLTAIFMLSLRVAMKRKLLLALAISDETSRVATGDCDGRGTGHHDIVDGL